VPPWEHPHFDRWALAQLRLYKPHYSLYELCFPSVLSVFDAHVLADGFPNINSHPASAPAESVSDDNKLCHEPDLLEPAPLETEVQQNDYHELMNIGRTCTSCTGLLGARELDIIHVWPEFAGRTRWRRKHCCCLARSRALSRRATRMGSVASASVRRHVCWLSVLQARPSSEDCRGSLGIEGVRERRMRCEEKKA
jgi:hypothetical protein